MKDAKKYNRIKLRLSLAGFFVTFTFMLWVFFSEFSLGIREYFGTTYFTKSPYLLMLAVVFSLGLMESVLSFPIDFYGGYLLEHRYGLSNQTLGRWAWEKLKGLLIGLTIGVPLLLAFYWFLRQTGNWWWFYTSCTLFLFSVIMARLAPTLLMPLFYKFSPLDRETLEKRLREKAKGVGLTLEGLFSFDMSKNTKKANAALTGLGKSRRVILGDTLIEKFSDDEIESVFVHELGHHHYRHILKMIFSGVFFTFGGFYFTHLGLVKVLAVVQARNPAYGGLEDPAVLPLFALFLTLYGLVVQPLQNMMSRYFEYQADEFAVSRGPGPDPFISAMNKLAEQNLADKDPHPLVELLFHSHPSIKKRIGAVQTS